MIKKFIIKSLFITTWFVMACLSAISGHDYYIGMKACEINYEVNECVKGVIWQPAEMKIAMEKLK